jgi:hypothetical protein
MNIKSPASCCFGVMPNSEACLIEAMVSAPALARPMICAPEDCALSRKDDKSPPGNGCRTAPTTSPPLALTTAPASFSSEWPKA